MSILVFNNNSFEKKTINEIYNLLTNEKENDEQNNSNSLTHSRKKINNNDNLKKIKFKKNFINLSEFTLNNDFPCKKLNFNEVNHKNNLMNINFEKFKKELNEIFNKESNHKIKLKLS